MAKHLTDVGAGRPLLDIASYARRGPGRRDRLPSAEIELIARTVNRTPEVMVKVLTRGGQDLGAVRRHLSYLNRGGELEFETDDGDRRAGKGIEKDLLDDWNLDLEEHRRRADLGPRTDRRPPKLVHKILFSMPPGTPPGKVLAAVKNFAREEFGSKHRYAMILHTDEPHPHVHIVVKAVGEQGMRLNIKKGTLRGWRQEFARHLRFSGVPANATERAVRGVPQASKKDGIYRAALRGELRLDPKPVNTVANQAGTSISRPDRSVGKLLETRLEVERGWAFLARELTSAGFGDLGALTKKFVTDMAPLRTQPEVVAERGRSPSRGEPNR